MAEGLTSPPMTLVEARAGDSDGARAPRADEADASRDATTSVGMAVTLGALSMTFGALLLAYAIVRAQAPSWPPPGEPTLPGVWPWPTVATLAAVGGSVAMRAARGRRSAADRRLKGALIAAAFAGAAFIAVQVSAWSWLMSSGFRPDGGVGPSVVYALTVFHAIHAGAALVALMPPLVSVCRGRSVRPSRLAALAAFWHLVTAAWVVVFLAVFVA